MKCSKHLCHLVLLFKREHCKAKLDSSDQTWFLGSDADSLLSKRFQCFQTSQMHSRSSWKEVYILEYLSIYIIFFKMRNFKRFKNWIIYLPFNANLAWSNIFFIEVSEIQIACGSWQIRNVNHFVRILKRRWVFECGIHFLTK